MSGPEGTRTPDPLHAMQVRYQLRHRPKSFVSLHKNQSTGTTAQSRQRRSSE